MFGSSRPVVGPNGFPMASTYGAGPVAVAIDDTAGGEPPRFSPNTLPTKGALCEVSMRFAMAEMSLGGSSKGGTVEASLGDGGAAPPCEECDASLTLFSRGGVTSGTCIAPPYSAAGAVPGAWSTLRLPADCMRLSTLSGAPDARS